MMTMNKNRTFIIAEAVFVVVVTLLFLQTTTTTQAFSGTTTTTPRLLFQTSTNIQMTSRRFTTLITPTPTKKSLLEFTPLVGGDHDDVEHGNHSSSTALEAIASAADSSSDATIDAGVLKKLDREMSEAAKKREKLELELLKVKDLLEAETTKLEEIETRKKQYLEGSKLGTIPQERTFSETAARSAVKAFAWRIIAGSVTFVTAFQFSRSWSAALKIVGSDFFSKSFTMFLGERLMNKSKAGRKGGADNVGRSLAKALVWRLFAICNTLTMAIFIAKDLSVASKIAGSDAIIKTAMMFAYERVWAKIEWGKEYQIEFSI